MNRGIFTAASGMGVLQARMDTVSNNMANVDTTGFKQDKVEPASFPEMMLQERKRVSVASRVFNTWEQVGAASQGCLVAGLYTDYSNGVLNETGKETDLALTGGGFFAFEVQGSGGTRVLYSRDGELHLNNEGYLVNSRGDKILSEEGPVQVGAGSFTVSQDGTLTDSDNNQVKLMVVDFFDKNKLVKEGENYYSSPDGSRAAAADTGVKQGYLENSNVDVTVEMISMIEIMRAYEAGQKIIQAQDELLGQAINQVGTVR